MKTRWHILGLSLALILTACGSQPTAAPKKTTAPKTRQTAVSHPKNHKPAASSGPLAGAVAVMVENSPQARPQSGLASADIVYEALAEGGITRFLALFYHHSAPSIGPVRSSRLYFIDLVAPYHVPYAHAGGSEQALTFLAKNPVPNLDDIYGSPNAFWRITSRSAPHNLYTSTKSLVAAAQQQGLPLVSLVPWPTGTDSGGSPSSGVRIVYTNNALYQYRTAWHYHNGVYLRTMNGTPHLMADGRQVTAANVVVMAVPTKAVPALDHGLGLEMNFTQGGAALFFRDGRMYQGTWQKGDAFTPLTFYRQGQPYRMAKGKVWVELVPSLVNVTVLGAHH